MESLQSLGQEYQMLSDKPGHMQINRGEFDRTVDGFNGRKHVVMKELAAVLGKPGTPSQEVIAIMGKPNDVTTSISPTTSIPLMPGPIIGSAGQTPAQGPFYLVYYWRAKHDYLWFKIDTDTQQVLESGWYMAGE